VDKSSRGYADPYVAGIGIGLVLLAAYVIVGQGLGASGAFASVVASGTAMVEGSARAAASPAVAPYLPRGIASPLRDWLVLQLAGVMLGGFASAWLAGRLRRDTERGSHVGVRQRMYAAAGGGLLMGVGAKLARGCTSGQALSGGALLSVGSWIFIVSCFAAGYAFAPLARRLWR
jgi:uncharacterized membrane protein YedE/YeeE